MRFECRQSIEDEADALGVAAASQVFDGGRHVRPEKGLDQPVGGVAHFLVGVRETAE